MKDTTVAVDISKEVFEIAVSERAGKVSKQRRLSRAKFLPFFAQMPPSVVVMEACGSAHYWGRRMKELGHQVKLLPTLHTKPYVRRNKTDRTDVRGLLEANRNEAIYPVPVKSVDRHVLCAIHRLRSAWIKTRTARVNLGRGVLREIGIFIPLGGKKFVERVDGLLEDAEAAIPEAMRLMLGEIVAEIRQLQERINGLERQLQALAKQLPSVQLLMSIPGIGIMTATALVGFVGDVHRFRSCRSFASSLGLTPREHSSGQRRSLGSISKQGNVYLRTLLTHGARSLLNAAEKHSKEDPFSAWSRQLRQMKGNNVAAIATANKLARIVYAVLKRGSAYVPASAS